MEKKHLALGTIMLDIEGTSLLEYESQRLQDPSVGAVILFSRNYEDRAQLCALTEQIRSLRDPPLLITVDQEGGRVQRFQKDFTRIPAMALFGKLYDSANNKRIETLKMAQSCAHLMAQELIECGIDFSFSPILDLGLHESTVIGDRAFHANPEKLIAIASAFIDGLHAAGMSATGKHFPGHGHVLADSHFQTPTDPRSFAEITASDLQPFARLKNKLSGVMTAHITFPCVDDALVTFSKYWLQNVLRKQIGFSGLIFSDDLSMHGACTAGNTNKRAEQAIAAGCDMILVCNDSPVVAELLSSQPWLAPANSQARYNNMRARPINKLSDHDIEQIKQQLSDLNLQFLCK